MSFQLICEIKVGKATFRYMADSIEIKSAFYNLTDTCELAWPRNLKSDGGQLLERVINIGDSVSVKLGYDNQPKLRFTGYIVEMGADTFLARFKCENEMFKLKQVNIKKVFKGGDVEEIIKHIKQKAKATWKYRLVGDKVSIGTFTADNINAAALLKKLTDDYGLYCFFRNGDLIIGKPYENDKSKRRDVTFAYARNVISWKDLQWKSKSEVKLSVKAISIMPNGKQKQVTVGDEGGDARTLHFYNLSEADLKVQAKLGYDKLLYDGYRGSFEAFGEPIVQHGDVAILKDYRYPRREGKYFIDGVTTRFTPTGMRQKIELGPQTM